MARVTVEKFVGSERETRFSFPAFLLHMASVLLPQSALSSLADRGINVRGILLARKLGIEYEASVSVVEKGISKTVVVSVV